MAIVKMRDVAAHAGVSISTVSKILSGSAAAHQIPAHTIERVRRSASQLGYIPNAVARNLRTQRTREIGIVLGQETYPEAAALTLDGAFLIGLMEAVATCHLPGMVVYPRERSSSIADVARYLDGRIEGLLVRSSTPHHEELLLSLFARSPLPVVAVWTQEVPDTVGFVDVDHRAGAYQAVRHLLDLGHRRIAYVESSPVFEHPHFLARYQGYEQALREAQVTFQPEWHVIGVEQEKIERLLQLPDAVTAIFTPNDVTAGAVATILHTLHRRIPGDISLVGFDDIANADLIAGGLTTVHQPIQEISMQAVRNLIALIGGTPVVECRAVLSTSLIIRNSSAPPATR
ncbi:LacI family DNA-binding transcriptional regulator [Dictyobacter formicarum]|uniref:LacI family transcriptional regulator n=1 Tax=Dictyobacter formicarum TaxID=2778368 RepID=A0ABQ3VDK6_9CHLR|nr:LacI family DNA-binding transcriptional regulator [Dictyobacter formicarum]GHO83478.1 LacI family transcriptional regulator [Dictyobacter formicarum]